MSGNYLEYIKHELSIFEEKQSIFAQRKVARLKLKKYICRQRACNTIAKELVPNKLEPTLICIGSTEIASNSPMKGYIRMPNRQLVAALRQRCQDILLVNEFRTTKLCHKCYGDMKTSRSPHRYQFCPKCGTCANRDVNAGINILYRGLCEIKQEDLNPAFYS